MNERRRLSRGLALLSLIVFVAFGALMLAGCEDKDPLNADGIAGPSENPVGNEPPETYLSLNLPPGVLPDTSRSSKQLNWWGEDIDGRVVGYQYRWGQVQFEDADTSAMDSLVAVDTLWYDGDWAFVGGDDETWVATDAEEVSFVLPIRSVSATFALQVRARDNDGAFDSTPAEIAFPIINSKPSIEFRLGSNPETSDPDTTDIDSTVTFPVRTFVWDANDPDGNESIERILYALDPAPGDTNWQELEGNESSVTLTDIEPGAHVFWVKVEDVAGFESAAIHYPDETNKEVDPDYWVVKPPAPGGFLIVDDYRLQANNNALHFYQGILDSLYNGGADGEDEVYSVWELEELPYATTDVTRTLLMFDNVLWYAFQGTPLLTGAFSSMYSFINTPGNRMLLTTDVIDPGEEGVDEGMLLDLATGLNEFTRRFATMPSDTVWMQPVDDPELPEIMMPGLFNFPTDELFPTESAEVIYRLDESSSDPPQYEGRPIIGVRRPNKSYTLFTMPLHIFDDPEKVGTVLRNTFGE